jgi:hypothetical protein
MPVYVGFVVKKVALGQVFLQVFYFSNQHLSICAPQFFIHLS